MKYMLSVIAIILLGSAIIFGFGFVYGQNTFEPQVIETQVVVEVPTIVTIERSIEYENGWKKITLDHIAW